MKTLNDGERFKLSAPPVDKPSNTTPTQMVNSVIGMLFSNVARFFGIFLFSFSLFSCVRFGSMEGRNMIFWGALGFIPYFGFWGLPLIVLVLSMFYGDTIVIT